MGFFNLLAWLVFGIVSGSIAKVLYPGDENIGFWQTIGLGVAGSFVGGLINYLLGWGNSFPSASGLGMSVIGSIIVLYVYLNWNAFFTNK